MYQFSYWLFTSKQSGDFVSFSCKAESLEKADEKAEKIAHQIWGKGVTIELKGIHEIE